MAQVILAVDSNYLPIVLMLIIAAALVAAMLGLSYLLGPGRKGAIKNSPYESGVDPVGSARARFHVRFYLMAILFLIFDVELIFFYPWAVLFYHSRSSTAAAEGIVAGASGFYLLAIIIFTVLLLIAFIYEWLRGGFDWR